MSTIYFRCKVPNLYGSSNTYAVVLIKSHAGGWVVEIDGILITKCDSRVEAKAYAIGWCKHQAADGDEIIAAGLNATTESF